MAGEYTLNTQLVALLERAVKLHGEEVNDELDLEYVVSELGFIATRASEIQDAAFAMNQALEKL